MVEERRGLMVRWTSKSKPLGPRRVVISIVAGKASFLDEGLVQLCSGRRST